MFVTYRGRDKILKNISDQEHQFIPDSDISNLESFDSILIKSTAPQFFPQKMSTLTGYSRISNGYDDSFNPIPNGKDRTLEFLNALKSRQMQAQQRANGHVARQKLQKQSLLERHAVFTASAKQISAELVTTCTKLESLANLARHRSLFDDRSEELEALTQKVRADITAINRQIAELQKATKTNYSTASQSNMIKHSNTVLVSLQSKLASISTDFKNVLEQRTQTLKEQKQRREQFSGGLSSSNSSGAASVLLDSMRPGAQSLVLRRNNTAAPPNGLLAPPKSLLYSTEEEERSAGKNKSSTHSSPSHSRSPSSALTNGSYSIDLDSGIDSGYTSSGNGNGNGSGSFRQQVLLVEQQVLHVLPQATGVAF